MQTAKTSKLGLFQPRYGSENSLLFAVGQFSLKADHVVERAQGIVLAQLDDASGFTLAAKLAIKGADGHRWRATEVLATIANFDKEALKSKSMDPLGILKTMAAEEKDHDEFFVYLDRVHKILRDRTEMIAIFAIAKDSKHQTGLTVPWGSTVGEVYWIVATRDKDQPYEYK